MNKGRKDRKRDYIDMSLTKREFTLLRKGQRVVKALNGTGKWISLFVSGGRVERQILKLKRQIAKLEQQL